MSGVMREVERLEGLEAHAASIALDAGALTECEVHGGILMYNMDQDADARAYAYATVQHKAGKVDGAREEFMGAMKAALDAASVDGCPLCARYMND